MEKDNKSLLFKTWLSIDKDSAFKYLYNKYKPLLIFIASSYLDNNEDILDVLQNSYIALYQNINNVDNIKSFLTTTCKNCALNLIKKNNVVTSNFDLENYPSNDNIKSHIAYLELKEKMNSILGDDDANVIIQHLINGYSFKKIAQNLNANEKTIKTRYYRSLKKFNKENKNE